MWQSGLYWRGTIRQHCPSLVSLQSLVGQPQRAPSQRGVRGGKPFGAQLTLPAESEVAGVSVG